MSESGKNKLYLIIGVHVVLLALAGLSWKLIQNSSRDYSKDVVRKASIVGKPKEFYGKDSAKYSINFLKAITSEEDTVVKLIRVSRREDLDVPYEIDEKAGSVKYKRIFNSRRVNICVYGVDSRLGHRYKHADANHVLSILIDEGKIELTSIPRDAPADAGFDDTTGQNKLCVVLGAKGRSAYLREAARIAGLDKIHYWAELGFSQSMGVLEILGFKNAKSTLQILRSRKALGGDDYQRSYNQGQFIKQMILKHFEKLPGVFGSMLLRGGLSIVNTNISPKEAKDIVDNLAKNGFADDEEDVFIRIRPPINLRFKVYDFNDTTTVRKIIEVVESTSKSNYDETEEESDFIPVGDYVANRLEKVLDAAAKDSARRPVLVFNKLRTYFDQRAWLQIDDTAKRNSTRLRFRDLLADAYEKRRNPKKASYVRRIINAEIELFQTPLHALPSPDSVVKAQGPDL